MFVVIVEPLLGTRAELVLVATDAVAATLAERAVVAEVRRLESIFSRFDKASALHAYRRTGATAVPELVEVVTLAKVWHRRSNGAFHPGAQPLIDLWDAAEATGVPPSTADLQRAVGALSAEPAAPTLDLNAIAKGWIADAALSKLVRAEPNVNAGWLNLGGDIVHRGDDSLMVGIEDPLRPYDNIAPLATIELSNEAIATSGGARRWWTIGGVRYPKVIDPRTGNPGRRVASATVVADDGATADALATVAVFLDVEETLRIADEVGADCFLIEQSGSITSSSDRFRQP